MTVIVRLVVSFCALNSGFWRFRFVLLLMFWRCIIEDAVTIHWLVPANEYLTSHWGPVMVVAPNGVVDEKRD